MTKLGQEFWEEAFRSGNEQGMEQEKRIELLRQTAINQLNTIAGLETPLTGVQDVLIE